MIEDNVVPASKVLAYIQNLKKESANIIRKELKQSNDINKVFKNVAEYMVLIGY